MLEVFIYLLAHLFIHLLIRIAGGMCGYPEIVKTFLGLGLNLSLIVFGIFTVSYVVLGIYSCITYLSMFTLTYSYSLGGLNFALEKQVEDSIKDIERQTGYS